MGDTKIEAAAGNSGVINKWRVLVKKSSMQKPSASGISVIRRRKAVQLEGDRKTSKQEERNREKGVKLMVLVIGRSSSSKDRPAESF